jgi:hypothetical protein
MSPTIKGLSFDYAVLISGHKIVFTTTKKNNADHWNYGLHFSPLVHLNYYVIVPTY